MKLMKAFWNTLNKYAVGVSAGLGLGVGVFASKQLIEMFIACQSIDLETRIAVIGIFTGAGLVVMLGSVYHVVVVRRLEGDAKKWEGCSDNYMQQYHESLDGFDEYKRMIRRTDDTWCETVQDLEDKATALQNKINAMKGARTRRAKLIERVGSRQYPSGGYEAFIIVDGQPWFGPTTKTLRQSQKKLEAWTGLQGCIDWGKE